MFFPEESRESSASNTRNSDRELGYTVCVYFENIICIYYVYIYMYTYSHVMIDYDYMLCIYIEIHV